MNLTMRWPRRGDDHGVTLVVAMMVMGVVMALTVTVIAVAISTSNQSGRDRQRTVSVNAAEAGVDAAYALIQASGTTLPCTWPASGTPADVNAGSDAAKARSTITYFKADGTPVGHCPTAADTGANAPATAVIDGYGETRALAGGTTNERHMQALVRLTPVYGDSLNKAIFADGDLQFKNQTTLTGNTGSDADVYTNRNFICANNQKYAGSVHSQGNVTVEGSCTVAGDVWAKGSVSNLAGANGSVGGRVLSSQSGIALPGNFNVNGSLLAAGAINWPGCTAGKCFANTSVAAPPTFPFPILRGNDATMQIWRDHGYEVIDHDVCSTVKDEIKGTYARMGQNVPPIPKVLVRTPCSVNFAKDKDIVLHNDLAIFADGGFSSSQQVAFRSDSAATRNLHWVVPADAVTSRPCVSPGVTTDNQFNFATNVNMLVYSPCNISFANNSDHIGQVFGGSEVTINNQFSMQYRPVPVFGIDPTSLPLLSYKIDIVYKRETR